jgi:hypothetical protein
MRTMLVVVMLLALAAGAPARAAVGEATRNPFVILDEAAQTRKEMSSSALAADLAARLATTAPQGADALLVTAELLKEAGDYRAYDYYELTIAADPDEPAYELFLADYLRNFRGPLRPLYAEAGRHYFAALEKLRHQTLSRPWGPEVGDRVERGLVALYRKDGIPLAWRLAAEDLLAPVMFFSPELRAARSTADLDEVHDARDFTAEALFAASAARLDRPLIRLRGRIPRPAGYPESPAPWPTTSSRPASTRPT